VGHVQNCPIPRAGRLALAVLCFALTGCSIPDSVSQRGNFLFEHYRTDAFGHIATRKAVYHLNGSRRTKVTDAAVSYTLVSGDSDRIIYDTCDLKQASSGEGYRPGCTHNYFDGHTGRDYVIGRGLKISMSALEDAARWSAGNYVIIGEDYELMLLNLMTGQATRLTDTLQLNTPFYPDKWQFREARWGGWLSDGAHGAVIVMLPHGPGGPPVYEFDEELYALDATTGTLTLVATHTGELGGTGERKLWRAGDFRWDGATLTTLPAASR
jgi:hypothetical protein